MGSSAPGRCRVDRVRFHRHPHAVLLLLVAAIGALLFLFRLGDIGLVDETPPLFAAAARAMAERGDWLVPQVNGLPRYDKPPLVYWLMGLLYALPGQSRWDRLGTWAACLPSALAAIGVMVALADTLLCWPQTGSQPLVACPARRPPPPHRPGQGRPARSAPAGAVTALTASLAFALCPLTLVWARIAVSDALFTALLALALLLAWRTYAAPTGPWWPAWVVVALALLTKGPAALLLLLITLGLFALIQPDRLRLWRRLRPVRGVLLSLALAAPWFLLTLWREGMPYWNSFFVYHNLQRFHQVVNNHHQPFWYFAVVLLLASLPYTPLLLLGLVAGLPPLPQLARPRRDGHRKGLLLPAHAPDSGPVPALSLQRFAVCWMGAVLLFFSAAATKLPSYWLPATPAAALLVALAVANATERAPSAPARLPPGAHSRPRMEEPWLRLAVAASALLMLVLAAGLAAAPGWVPLIEDPGMPGLSRALMSGPWFLVGAGVLVAASIAAVRGLKGHLPQRLLQSQLVLLLLVPLVVLPLALVVDQLRAAPVRVLAAEVVQQSDGDEPLAMVGLIKPSLHFYSRRTVIYEGRSATALVNLVDRLARERRPGLQPSTALEQPHLLLVIDAKTVELPHWQGLGGRVLARADPYRLLRLDRRRLELRSRDLQARGVEPSWQDPRPERF